MVREIKGPWDTPPPEPNDQDKKTETPVVDINSRIRKPPRGPDPDQIDLPLNQLAGAEDIFKNYERMWRTLDVLIKKIPESWRRRMVQENWDTIKSKKLTDEEIRAKFLETNEQDWEVDPMFFYALILEATERKLFL
ncbi:MAG: hypothetical protein AAB943_00400 [Patescibacteria group bacterium]